MRKRKLAKAFRPNFHSILNEALLKEEIPGIPSESVMSKLKYDFLSSDIFHSLDKENNSIGRYRLSSIFPLLSFPLSSSYIAINHINFSSPASYFFLGCGIGLVTSLLAVRYYDNSPYEVYKNNMKSKLEQQASGENNE